MKKNISFHFMFVAVAFGVFFQGCTQIKDFVEEKFPTLSEKFSSFGSKISGVLPQYQIPSGNDDSGVVNSAEELSSLKAYSKVFSNLAKATRPALVFVKVKKKVEVVQQNPFSLFDDFFGGSPFGNSPFGNSPFGDSPFGNREQRKQERVEEGSGSGFFVDLKNGYVATNNHVVQGASEITVRTFSEREYLAELVGAEPSMDVAVLRVKNISEEQKKSLGEVLFAKESAQVGDWVVALGAPFGLPQTLTVGVVSATGRGQVLTDGGIEDFIQTDASINPGNSGGPLLNMEGNVVGINTAISSPSGASAGIGFSIPVNIAKPAIEMMISDGKVTRGFVGIEGRDVASLSEEGRAAWKLESSQLGVIVSGLVAGGPAEKSGLKTNDVITSLNGELVENYSQFRAKVSFLQPESIVPLEILRDGRKVILNLKIAKRPDEKRLAQASGSANTSDDSQDESSESEKSTTQNLLTESQALQVLQELGLELFPSKKMFVAKVKAIARNSAASQMGLLPGDTIVEVSRAKISSLREMATKLKNSLEQNDEVILTVERNGRMQLLIFSL